MVFLLIVILCIVWLLFVIITNNNSKTKEVDTDNFKHINNTSSAEGIIYPIHIKYKMLERNEHLYPTDLAYSYGIKNSPTYKCILDDEAITGISIGQEMDLDVTQGEHVIVFEANIIRNKIENK